jgi:phage terminase large subunit-like protein
VGVAKPTEDRLARRRRARAASATPKTGRDRRISRGERNCRWIEEHCRVPEGKLVGQPVRLRPWQRRIIKAIYDQGARRVIISFARKNGKTALAAMLLLLHLCGPEAKENSSLNSAAQSLEQAAILFRLASKMVRMSPDLDEFVRVREQSKELACDELGTLYKALSAEASTAYGLSPVFVVHDELGQVRGATTSRPWWRVRTMRRATRTSGRSSSRRSSAWRIARVATARRTTCG